MFLHLWTGYGNSVGFYYSITDTSHVCRMFPFPLPFQHNGIWFQSILPLTAAMISSATHTGDKFEQGATGTGGEGEGSGGGGVGWCWWDSEYGK